MDVVIERRKDGNRFKMEIGFFDTVLEIKEKIQKYHGIPVPKQSLFIRGAAMADDRDTEHYELVEGSKIDLVVIDQDEEEKQEIVMVGGGTDDDDDHDEDDEGENKKKKQKGIRFKIKVSVPAMRRWITMDVEGGETVAQLKEMIGIEGLAVGRMALMVGGVEMQDPQRALREYGVVEGTEVSVVVRSAAGVTAAAVVGKRITVMVLVKGVTKKVGVEVNVMESVRELRKELERLERLQRLMLPTEGYFFIYKQEVMEEERSFRWHGVKNNDIIEVFNGSVTGGS
ncbi:ubiquitin C protein [Dioscorea alata]|uniref:Ubiquitin C protein n=1 Tax=Dioscorea alata TaxID=55571 RepID=A0ACB7TY78_DIOAL|nr:ubiquitin C protein [Dioscorea alata]